MTDRLPSRHRTSSRALHARRTVGTVVFAALALVPATLAAQALTWLGTGVSSFNLVDNQTASTATNVCRNRDVTATFVDSSGLSLAPFPIAHSGINGAAIGMNLTATPTLGSTLTIDFGAGNQVENLSMLLYDVDQVNDTGSAWTDLVTVTATFGGAATTVNLSCAIASCAWNDLGGGSAEGDTNNSPFADPPGQVTVDIPGPVDLLVIAYTGTGPGTANQFVGYGPMTFSCSPTPALNIELESFIDAQGRQELALTADRSAGVLAYEIQRWQPGRRQFRSVGTVQVHSGSGRRQQVVRLASADADRGTTTYRVIEHDAVGAKHRHGPFEVTPQAGRAPRGRQPAPLRARSRRAPSRTSKTVWTETRESGIATLPLSSLPPAVRNRRATSGNAVELTSGGAVVPTLTSGDAIFWLATAYEDLWTTSNAYRLRNRLGAELLRESPLPPVGAGSPLARYTLTFEENTLPATAATTDTDRDYWYWQSFLADGNSQTESELPFTLGVSDEPTAAELTVRLVGATLGTGADVHRAALTLNGAALGTVTWNGREIVEQQLAIPAGLLANDNILTIAAELADGQQQSIFYLDSIELSFTASRSAQADRAEFTAETTVTEISGFTSGELFAMALDGDTPAWIEPASIVTEPSNGGFTARLATTPGRRYFLAAALGLMQPELRAPGVIPEGIHDRAELVIVTPDDLLAEAAAYAALRSAAGVTSLVVDVQYLYDRFSAGRPDPWAIQSFLAWSRQAWGRAPSYLLVAGNATLDPRDFLGLGDNLIPTPLAATNYGLYSADNALGDIAGDRRRETLVARLPVVSAEQFAAYTEKVRSATAPSAAPSANALFFADDADPAGNFPLQAQALADLLTTPTSTYAIGDLPFDELRELLATGWNEGPSLLTFVGHGSSARLAGEGLLLAPDIGLQQAPVRFFMGLTCTVNRHELPGQEALGESLVLAPLGGALVSLAPSGLSVADPALELGALITSDLAGADTIGASVLHGLNLLVGDDPAGIVPLYSLLGDPSLSIDLD